MHNSTNVSIDGTIVAKSGERNLQVESTKRVVHIESFDDLLVAGTKDQVLDFLKTENLFSSEKKFDFEKVCFLLKDKDFFLKVISVLKERSIFSREIW